MYNPFQTLTNCARFATRRAYDTGNVHHVIATGDERAPLRVVDDIFLFNNGHIIEIDDLKFTADPFAESAA